MEEQKWKGESRGNALGYNIFIWLIKNLGLYSAYFMLLFVTTYFVLFSRKTNKDIYSFYREALHFSKFKSIVYIWKNYYQMGQTLIDKAAIFSGKSKEFTLVKPNYDNLLAMIQEDKPSVFIMSHVGNFEAAGFLVDLKKRVNLLTYEAELAHIKKIMDDLKEDGLFKSFTIKYDGSHIFELQSVMEKKEILCLHGDRYLEGTKTITADFFGKPARFTYGPFYLADRFNANAAIVSLVKSGMKEYTLEHRRLDTSKGQQDIANQYAKHLESFVKKYPESWFNYYNFWA